MRPREQRKSWDELTDVLTASITGKTCIQAWLGYADVLFVGFDRFVDAPVRMKNGRLSHANCAYEVKTRLAHWIIRRGNKKLGSSHDDPRAAFAARALVGRRVVGWTYLPRHGLKIQFDRKVTLLIIPYRENSRRLTDGDAWSVSLDDGYYWSVRRNGWKAQLYGAVYRLHGDAQPTRKLH